MRQVDGRNADTWLSRCVLNGLSDDRQVNCLAPLEEMEYPALQFLQTAAYHNFNSSLLRPAARMPAVGSLAESDKELDLVEV
jgi:hypothetical protein